MLELPLVQFRETLCAAEIRRLPLLLKLNGFAECVFEPAFNQIDGQISNINANPAPTELLRSMNRCAATAKRIKHDITFLGAGFNYFIIGEFFKNEWSASTISTTAVL